MNDHFFRGKLWQFFLRAVHFWGRGNQKVFGENRLKIAEIDCNRRFSENSPLVGRLGFRDPDSVSFQSLFLFIQTSWRAYPDTAPYDRVKASHFGLKC